MSRFDLPCLCQESPEQKAINVCLSLIYADEHVVISYPHRQLACLWCPEWVET
jgi:hypothetical protein